MPSDYIFLGRLAIAVAMIFFTDSAVMARVALAIAPLK
jgi:hypothetical protein